MGMTTPALFLAKSHNSISDLNGGQSRIRPLSSVQVLWTLLIFFKSVCPKLYVFYPRIFKWLKKIKGYTNFQNFQRAEEKTNQFLSYCRKSTGKETGKLISSKIFKCTCVSLRWDMACSKKHGNLLIKSSKKYENTFQECFCRDRAFVRLLQLRNCSYIKKNFPQFSCCTFLLWKI